MTSNGTTGTQPRRMVASHPVGIMERAHRPVPAVPSFTDHQGIVTTTTTATTNVESLRPMELGDDNDNMTVNNKAPTEANPKKPSLLEDDEAASDLWKPTALPMTKPSVTPPPLFDSTKTMNDAKPAQQGQQPKLGNDNNNIMKEATLGEAWEPQPGGSFMVYRRTH